MAGQVRGHTTQGGQLELEWEIPPATAATTDFVCWLWAAFPPRDGRLHVSRIAKALDISASTLRRWIAKDDPKLRKQQIPLLHRRAILRGRGHYLWPDLDPVTRRRSELLYETALRNDELITNEPDRVPKQWHQNGTLDTHEVHVVYFPRAHVYGVAATRHEKAEAKIRRHGEILETLKVDNKYAAVALKHEILQRVDEHRCITPRHLVPTGRTETWRETGGPTAIRRPLEVHVVRFAGLRRFAKVTNELREAHPSALISEHEARSAEEACEALTQPADVVILTSHGYTRQTWAAKRPWPGGRWYAGGRGRQAAGISLEELTGGVEQVGGLQTPLLVLDTYAAAAAAPRLRHLTHAAGGRLLIKTGGGAIWDREEAALVDLIGRLSEHHHGEDLDQVLADLPHYALA